MVFSLPHITSNRDLILNQDLGQVSRYLSCSYVSFISIFFSTEIKGKIVVFLSFFFSLIGWKATGQLIFIKKNALEWFYITWFNNMIAQRQMNGYWGNQKHVYRGVVRGKKIWYNFLEIQPSWKRAEPITENIY